MLQDTSPSEHQGLSSPRPLLQTVCISGEQNHRRCHCRSSPLCAEPPRAAAKLQLNALCGLQLSFQYNLFINHLILIFSSPNWSLFASPLLTCAWIKDFSPTRPRLLDSAPQRIISCPPWWTFIPPAASSVHKTSSRAAPNLVLTFSTCYPQGSATGALEKRLIDSRTVSFQKP